MVRSAVSGCAVVALASVAFTGVAPASASDAPRAEPRVTVTPASVKQKAAVTVRVVNVPKTCRAVQAKSDAFAKPVMLAKKTKPLMYTGQAAVKANAAPGSHQVVVGGIGCGKWVAKGTFTVPAAPNSKVVKGTVTSKAGLFVRRQPTSNSPATGTYRYRQTIALVCKKAGQPVAGNRTWYRVNVPKGWVTARYVKAQGFVPNCK
ncbi:SH3 domain-containing protein [Streptomyces sp. NPDC051218]|uniref:SH3 domain-containing protein n=1 Tax=Streptomyces sp. NPDC051218 TaxID=3365645 RepID=UPI00379839C6